MNIHTGNVIISTALLNDTNFEKVVIVIAEHNEKGTIGYIINQQFERRFNELEEFKHALPVPLYIGGPSQMDKIYFMHRKPAFIEGGELIDSNVYMNGDFKTAVQLVNNGTLAINDIKLYIGYCGWDVQQLEEEIAEGSWLITTASADLVFSDNIDTMWDDLTTQHST
ncbi:YqgE/AlgH family protein [Lacibacter sp. H407]|uniref:YqgE/AlgH family protein n=1 Tax=Lacibacter sp. H407 TaxID=3133423 RepID=UPI0030BB670A